jgi:hypothetical protein
MHELDTDHDFRNCYKLAKKEAIVMWDDSESSVLSYLWNIYIEENKIQDITSDYRPTYIHQHTIGLIKK